MFFVPTLPPLSNHFPLFHPTYCLFYFRVFSSFEYLQSELKQQRLNRSFTLFLQSFSLWPSSRFGTNNLPIRTPCNYQLSFGNRFQLLLFLLDSIGYPWEMFWLRLPLTFSFVFWCFSRRESNFERLWCHCLKSSPVWWQITKSTKFWVRTHSDKRCWYNWQLLEMKMMQPLNVYILPGIFYIFYLQ